MTVRAWLRWPVLVALGAALVLAALQGALGANDSPQLWDFEGEDALVGWTQPIDVMSLAPGDGVANSQVASITIETLQLRATVGITHPVQVQPGYGYTLGGEFLSVDGDLDWVELGIVFRDEDSNFLDAAGFALSLPGSWDTNEFAAPCEAVQGDLRILARGAAATTIHVDDLSLKESAPATPCPTPTASPTQTQTSTPTATPSPSPSPTDTAIPTNTATLAEPTSTPSDTPAATATPAAATNQPATATNTPPPATATGEPAALASLEFTNGDFEQGTDGEPDAWQTFGGLLMQSGTPARSGSWSGALFSSTNSTKWAFQTVGVEPANWYQFQAYVYHDDPWVESALLRISWYASDDGTGSAVATVDSTDALTTPAPEFRSLSTGPVMAPPGVQSAKVRVLMRPRDETGAAVYIDDATFGKTDAPIPPTNTPALLPPTASATPLATSTNTPTPQPAAVATSAPTNTPEPTQTPRPANLSTPIPAATATPTLAPEPPAIASALTNGGFESAIDGALERWGTFGGVLSQVDLPVRSGQAAGGFFSSSGSTKWVYQTVAVEPTAWYQFDAFVYQNHPFVDEAFLRVSWYASADGSGSALVSVDSTDALATPAPGYRPLSTGPVQSPPGARSAKLRILMRPLDERSALIYIDDVSFERVAATAIVEEPPAPASAPASSQVLSSFEPAAPVDNQQPATTGQQPAYTPMPVPVIRRHALQTPDQLATPREGDSLWPWALLGATAGAGAVGWSAYWALRRRSSSESLTQAR